VRDVAALVRTPPLSSPTLAVDKTGVGAAVVDLFQGGVAAELRPVLLTAGHVTTQAEDGSWHVPKKELVSTLQVLFQNRRLTIAPMLERELLVKELLAFRVKITVAANETFEAWRERDHDDLVLAVALACWVGERCPAWGPEAFGWDTSGSVIDKLPADVIGPRQRPGEAAPRDQPHARDFWPSPHVVTDPLAKRRGGDDDEFGYGHGFFWGGGLNGWDPP
jgi:hypothetical protein